MVIGTSEGFTKDLQLIGVGYRAAVNGKELNMNLGFSHPVKMEIPPDVEVKVSNGIVMRVLSLGLHPSTPMQSLFQLSLFLGLCQPEQILLQ